MTFRDRMASWQDWDAAEFHLAVALGILPDEPQFAGRKDLFWSNNPVGNCLTYMLVQMEKSGMLERNEDDQYRWIGVT